MSPELIRQFHEIAPSALRQDVPPFGDIIHRPRSDFDLENQNAPSGCVELPDEALLKPAAVLVPVILRPDGATVLFTRRSAALRSHSGQISFPGGRIDGTDASALDAALRETQEEIGLDRSCITPLGFLDAYLTGTGYRIVPVVAVIEQPFALTLNPHEVDEVFEAPLAFLMDAVNHRRDGREWKGKYRSYYAIAYGERYIWGATAGILRNLHDRLIGAGAMATGETV